MDNVLDFFIEKKPWSKYKDLILGYYLEPYLFKVAKLGKPIVVVDCFAGPGRFGDNEPGSPIIISEKLLALQERNIKVSGFYIEHDPVLFEQLQNNTKALKVPIKTRFGSFKDYIPELSELAKSHTVFIYLDPIKPSDLYFNDLKAVYDQLNLGQSVETLINFMSTNFWRAILGSKDKILKDGIIQNDHKLTAKWNDIAGGIYWQDLTFKGNTTLKNPTDALAKRYAKQLQDWFKYVLTYPIREKYEHELPKYHLIFGSRWPDAIDLMNRAMVKARREFVGARFVKGMLFDNQPAKEVVDPAELKDVILNASKRLGKTTWKLLRIEVTITQPSMYTDSEINKIIKQVIREKLINSDCSGQKIEEKAFLWP